MKRPEVETITVEQLRAMPEVSASELVQGDVYILEGVRYAASLNYAGVGPFPGWHTFDGPRVMVTICLCVGLDGVFYDATGSKITVRKYDPEGEGEDEGANNE